MAYSKRGTRDSITPMDYEYENGRGPTDEFSPFMTATKHMSSQKRQRSVLDNSSPARSFTGGFNTPQRPPLRESKTLSYQGSKPLPAVPSHVSNAWTPRTPEGIMDCSSGGETPNTPAYDDSEAATPDTQMADRMGRMMNGDNGPRSKSPKKSRRSSLFSFKLFGSSSSPSPLKEDRKSSTRKPDHRVAKRRKKTRDSTIQEYEESDEEVLHVQKGGKPKDVQVGYMQSAASFFHWVEAHPDLPSVLSFYFQFFVNGVLGTVFLWFIWAIYKSILADIQLESQKYITEIMGEIATCSHHYTANRCDRETRAPALETVCSNWETCMNRDPRKVARAAVGAKTFAQIFNAFVENLSYKTMIFTALLIFGGFNVSNWAFGVIRAKSSHPQPHPEFYPPPPATPQRIPSGGFIDQQGFYTPFQTPYGNMNHQHMLHPATQSMPALPAPDLATGAGGQLLLEAGKRTSPRKKLFR
ncbi:Di-sulfide bridge nucleocytoplasmic transport domain-containing protein [Dendryphion nanum]|uniref:Di-sulfide bridge nucleocytoplasmic transport domain-containing protein n=1 Tax=Dendryphion nanum TaxID=256645 RepID=A0A9P9EL22_9PLEO|nr:Di-sulfide bridge nucleocytoplasmic transport domain-containing protein [Dendryphion nanum]